MQVRREGKDVLFRLDPGEELVGELVHWARKSAIPSAVMTGLGAVRDVHLGYFDLDARKYVKIPVPRHVEIVSLDGSIGVLDDEYHAHVHVTVSSSGGNCVAGHLFQAMVSITAEIHMTVLQEPLRLVRQPETGILLWDLA
ncbi:MAG: DUF296 domain-containing protein [Acidobacteriota bacterium]|jgi:uncharacterized protein